MDILRLGSQRLDRNRMGSGGMLSLLASVICGEMNGLPRQ
uniref:Uncharacterized protein n=1 Tax=Pyricularia oryzae (strain P131) TaxID=1143193 RepID=L7J718_PYRO1